MPKGRDLRAQLRHSYFASTTKHKERGSEANESVTERLAKLRAEQLRAERNRQRKLQTTTTTTTTTTAGDPVVAAAPIALLSHGNDNSLTLSPQVAGPAPPPSWRNKLQHALYPSIVDRPPTERTKKKDSSSSLLNICTRQIAYQLGPWYRTQPEACKAQFAQLSPSVKQMILKSMSEQPDGDRMTDDLLELFKNDLYAELIFEGGLISFKKLLRTFWEAAKYQHQDDSLHEDWEDLIETTKEEDDDQWQQTYHYDPESHDECSLHLRTVLRSLLAPSEAASLASEHWLLYTPLSAKLISLNISFIRPLLPALSMAYLITSTLSDLSVLSMAGCLSPAGGPRALTVLSRGLRKLTYWDIGYHFWITADTICPCATTKEDIIDWKRDLQNLKTLCLVACGPDRDSAVGDQVASWFAQQQKRVTVIRRVE